MSGTLLGLQRGGSQSLMGDRHGDTARTEEGTLRGNLRAGSDSTW